MNSYPASVWKKPLAKSHIALAVVSIIALAAVAAAVFIYALPVQTKVLDAKKVLESRLEAYATATQQYTLEGVDPEKLRELLEQTPLSRLDSEYLQQFQKLSAASSVHLSSFSVSYSPSEAQAEDAEAAPTTAESNKRILTVSVIGTLADLHQYMRQVHSSEPLYTVTQWSISGIDNSLADYYLTRLFGEEGAVLKGDGKFMSLNLTIETYVVPQYVDLLAQVEATEPAATP